MQRLHVNQHRVACPVAYVLFLAPLQDTCWKHFKDVVEASEIYWYLATCNFCAERLRVKTGRARAHLGCVPGQNVRTCGTVLPEIRDQFSQPVIVGKARLHDRLPSTRLSIWMPCGMPSRRAT